MNKKISFDNNFLKTFSTVNSLYKSLLFTYLFELALLILCSYWQLIDTTEARRIGCQTTALLCMLICIPYSFKIYSTKIKALQAFDSNEYKVYKLGRYHYWSLLRMTMIILPTILTVHSVGNSWVYCAGIGFLAYLFCIPTKKKIRQELDLEETINS